MVTAIAHEQLGSKENRWRRTVSMDSILLVTAVGALCQQSYSSIQWQWQHFVVHSESDFECQSSGLALSQVLQLS